MRSGWKELEAYGYVRKYPVREDGHIAYWRTEIFEQPQAASAAPAPAARKQSQSKVIPFQSAAQLKNQPLPPVPLDKWLHRD